MFYVVFKIIYFKVYTYVLNLKKKHFNAITELSFKINKYWFAIILHIVLYYIKLKIKFFLYYCYITCFKLKIMN